MLSPARHQASFPVSVHSHRSRAGGFVWRPSLINTANEALLEEGEIAVVLPGAESLIAAASCVERKADTMIDQR